MMNTTIFYYTGTGNSLWVARRIAGKLGGSRLIFMSGCEPGEDWNASDTLGLVFPVYIWGVPAPVIRFVHTLKGLKAKYIFAVAVNAGQVSNTLVQLHKIMAGDGLKLSSGFDIVMPSNYIPWGGPGPKEEQQKKFDRAQEKISDIADIIKQKSCLRVERGPLWQRIIFTAINRVSFSHVSEMDKKFRADDKCNACEICLQVCPAGNITLSGGKPVWHHRCHQCFACLQWCPVEAIQYGRKTTEYERYHHPEVVLKDVLKQGDGNNEPD